MNENKYYPKNYHDSRQRFIHCAKSLPTPSHIGQWEIPGQIDDDLFVDHIWLPPTAEAKKIFVITSGIHGSECYAGSAIQQMLMQELLPRIDRQNTGVFIVHAMNPYGFKHHERCTEAMVNLNRNFSVSGDMYHLQNEDSFRLNERFIPKEPVQSRRSFLLQSLNMQGGKPFFDTVSMDELVKGTARGQFETPDHLEYGGRALEPQSRFFIDALGELLPDFEDVIGLDLHTGLGDRGRLHMLAGGEPGQLNESLFNELFDPRQDQDFYVFTPASTEGFYETYGGIDMAFTEVAKKDQRVCAITMEFGTLGHSLEAQIEGMNSFFLHHQGRFHGYANPQLEAEVMAANFDRCYPNDGQWKIAVMKAARGTFERIFGRAGCLR